MRSCSSCGSQYPDHAHFCGHCGTHLTSPQQGQVAIKEMLHYPLVPLQTLSDGEGVSVVSKTHQQDSIRDGNDACAVSSQHTPTLSTHNSPLDYPEYSTIPDAPSILASQRQTILEDLLSLISFVDEAHRVANQEQFTCNAAAMPPIEDDSWGRIAFITGIYGRYMWKQPLSNVQRMRMWRALVWSVRYEQTFRPKLVNDRSAELFIFLNGASHDQDFLAHATQDVITLIKELHIATVKKLNERLVKLSLVPDEIVDQFRTLIEKRLAAASSTTQQSVFLMRRTATTHDSEFEQIIQAIEQCWPFLDKKAETSNRALFQQARYMLHTPGGQKNLAVLAGSIVRQSVHRYLHEGITGNLLLPDQQLQQILLLAQFATSRNPDPYIDHCLFLLTSLQSWRKHAPNALSFIDTAKKRCNSVKTGDHAPDLWGDVVKLVTHYLAERRITHTAIPGEAEEWMQAISDIPDLSPSDQKRFLAEARRHYTQESALEASATKKIQEDFSKELDSIRHAQSPLTHLVSKDGENRGQEFLDSIRNSQLERAEAILQDARQALLSALCEFLASASFTEIQPPRRALHIRNRRGEDLFLNARNQIISSQPELWREALSVFEQGERETMRKDFKAIACEWSLFAQARVNGPVRVVPRWEEHRALGTASWEEIWNLAVFYAKVDMFPRALAVLAPGVTELQAPFAHLRFSLYCGAQILARADKEPASAIEQATSFLISHLVMLPYPLCYLAWLLLTYKHQPGQDFIERLQMLSLFQETLEHPVIIPPPEMLHDNTMLETLEKHLRHLKLDTTWYAWIQDYAERHPYIRKAWQSLAEICEQAGYIEQTAKALQHIARIQIEQYQHHSHKGMQPPDLRYLRATLIKLFEFYRRHGMTANSNAAFHMYYRAMPELWDSNIPSNKLLIDLTYSYMEGHTISPASKLPGDAAQTWLNLQAALSSVNELDTLKELQSQLHEAVDLIAAHQKSTREGAAAIKQILDEICHTSAITGQRQALEEAVRRLNEKIEDIQQLVKEQTALVTFKALVAAIQRVFETFCEKQQLVPMLHVQLTPIGPGLPYDQPATALVIRLSNPGPGKVTSIQGTCSDNDHIVSRSAGSLACIEEQSEGLITIPVTAMPTHTLEPVMCQVRLTYRWGIIHDITSTHTLAVPWYNFHDFLHQHHVSDYEFPIPYVFDTAIDFNKHDSRLFQGREQELNLVHNMFLKGQMAGMPLYFYGIRKVGKTSLLHRISLELQQGPFLPVVVDLHGIKALQQSLHVVINTLTTRILNMVEAAGLDITGIEPVPVSHANPIMGVEAFFQAVSERAGQQQIVLLLDEFHVTVAERTTPLLDLLRRIHQNDVVLFIMSGWLRPELLQAACPETQLFPLIAHPVDFLPPDTVRQVLHVPTADYGITIPEETVQRVYAQTAGNPYHVAKLASFGIAQLNAEHRTVLAPQDIDEIAATLAHDPANFTCSSFSPLIFTPEEQSAALRFVRELGSQRHTMPVEEAVQRFGAGLVRGLEEKHILERSEGQLAIKSNLLAMYLRTRASQRLSSDLSTNPTRKVGIFVDYENLLPLLPTGMKPRQVGEALLRYASQFGEIACSWACADPRNIPDITEMRLGLEQAGFTVQYPRGEPSTGPAAKNVTDFTLLERITEESMHNDPENRIQTYILVSGDCDYYEKITSLLNHGHTVRLLASSSTGHLASKYRRLQEQRTQISYAEGRTEPDFFIDDLDCIL
jgi:hypothetical protein